MSIRVMAISQELSMHIGKDALLGIRLIIVGGISNSILHIGIFNILNTVRNVIHRFLCVDIAHCHALTRTQRPPLYTTPFRRAHALNVSFTKTLSTTESGIIS